MSDKKPNLLLGEKELAIFNDPNNGVAMGGDPLPNIDLGTLSFDIQGLALGLNLGAGVVAISQERQKQISKHGFTDIHSVAHPEYYNIDEDGGELKQLQDAAIKLLAMDMLMMQDRLPPEPIGWNIEWFNKLCGKSRKERLIIAGALIAAELDRLQLIELNQNKS